MPAAELRPALRAHDAQRPVAAVAVALVLGAAALTWLAPMPALLLAPLLLGVPHVVGDLWVLLLRPGAQRRVWPWVVAPLLGLVLLRALAAAGLGVPAPAEVALGALAVLLGAASTRSAQRVGLALLACLPLLVFWDRVGLVLGHLHNAVAVAVLVWWGPRRLGLAVAGVCVVVAAAIFAGLADGALAPFGGLDPDSLARTLAPGVAAPWAGRWVSSFCFAQLVHYLCWVGLLPVLLRDRPGPRRPLLAALRADLGRPLVAAAVVGAVAVPLLATWDPVAVRSGYLSLVLFHGWMELSVLAAWRRAAP